MSPSPATADELLRRAAQCYERAGLWEDALRLFVETGDDLQSAICCERLGRHAAAAGRFAKVAAQYPTGQAAAIWRDAARCFGVAELWEDQANALNRSGDSLHGAWVLAHRAHRYLAARGMLAPQDSNSPIPSLERQIVMARCEAGAGAPAMAARLTRRVIQEVHTLPPAAGCERLIEWILDVTSTIRRPDLAAATHAAAAVQGHHNAAANWQEWARRTLQSASGVPLAPESHSEPGDQVSVTTP